MPVHVYWLSFKDVDTDAAMAQFLAEAPLLVDASRRKKAEKLQSPRARAVCLGAGLLLQKMVLDFNQKGSSWKEETGLWEEYHEALELIGRLREEGAIAGHPGYPLDLSYEYGSMGKPRLSGYPLHFNLSHSGDYVLCAASDREIGVDIQKLQTLDELGLARRYFTSGEYEILQGLGDDRERSRLFFRLWTRKEAYGKLTGEGITQTLGQEFLSEDAQWMIQNGVRWIDLKPPEGYETGMVTSEGRETESEGSRNLPVESEK